MRDPIAGGPIVGGPVVVVNRGCASAGCAALVIPIIAVVGFVWVAGSLVDAILPGSVPWWLEAIIVVIGINLSLRWLARRARRRMGVDRRDPPPPGVIDV